MKNLNRADRTIISSAFEETYAQIGEKVFYAPCVDHYMDSYGKNVIYIGKLNHHPLNATVSSELNVKADLNNIESVYDRDYKTVNLVRHQCMNLKIFPKTYDAFLINNKFYIILGKTSEGTFNTESLIDSYVTCNQETFNSAKLIFK